MRKLIVTADDLGAALEVNDAVEKAHREGILTCASLMVTGAASADAVERARRMPGLGVGLHLVLVDGKPVLPPEQIPDLVDGEGRFRDDMVRTAVTIFAKPGARRQLHAEIEAQFAAFRGTGLRLDHVNAHKHFHLHPTIAGAILSAGRRYGMRAVRAPVEPRRPVDSLGRERHVDLARWWARLLRRRLRASGMQVPDQVFGLRWSGAFDRQRMRALIPLLPEGVTEIYLHPATGPYPGSAPGYAYGEELETVLDPIAKQMLAREKISLARFADLSEGE